MNISLKSDMTVFNEDVVSHRNWVMTLTFIMTGLAVFIVLLILQRSAIPSLAKIHDVLEKIHLHSKTDSEGSRILFEQLLEQIIRLRRKSGSRFSVMILDLTHFKKINADYGEKTADQLLIEVEQRLSSVLRGSDLISWVGTDTPGHKLLPSGTKTQYRATIAGSAGMSSACYYHLQEQQNRATRWHFASLQHSTGRFRSMATTSISNAKSVSVSIQSMAKMKTC